MTILFAASPGSASQTLRKNLEAILGSKSKNFKSGADIGTLLLNIPLKEKILKKLKLDTITQTDLIYGHIFPTKHNMTLLDQYFEIKHTIISYRNIYDQLNNFYKWQKYNLRGPLNFPEDKYFSYKKRFYSDNYNIDLNLLLVLNFYKHWFYLIQKNKIKKFTLISFDEITSFNKQYKKKIYRILKNTIPEHKIKFNIKVNENLYKDEKFKLHSRHKKMIKDFVALNEKIDFSLIL